MRHRTIHIEPAAPAKPALGQPCNGCGVCCLAEPCPLGMVLSRRRSGRCVALRWDADTARYTCGALAAAGAGPGEAWWQRWQQRLVRRWIGAGVGCDCDLEVAVASSDADHVPTGNRHD